MCNIKVNNLKIYQCISIFIIVISITFLFPVSVFATADTNTNTSSSQSTNNGDILSPTEDYSKNEVTVPGKNSVKGDIDEANKVYNSYIDVMPQVSTNDLVNWTLTKGNQIIYYLQICVQPITTIAFIISALMCLVGSIGRGDMVGKGFLSMIISIIVYAAVLYAPVILQTSVGWIASTS